MASPYLFSFPGERDQIQITRRFSLEQYNKAIRQLGGRMSDGGSHAAETMLICCVLFICIESVRGNTDQALGHLENGLDILRVTVKGNDRQKQSTKGGAVHIFDDELVNQFLQLDIQATSIVDKRTSHLLDSLDKRVDIEQPLRTSFLNVDTAKTSLEKLTLSLFHFLKGTWSYLHDPSANLPPILESERKI